MNNTLMVQGTTSDAGKSVLVTGLCRLFYRRGLKVAPFKPQNMALNSAVTLDGGEIGRAQAVQAQAAGLQPHTDMNPVLLKPSSDTGAQVIIHGKALDSMEAGVYHDYKPRAMAAVLASHQRLGSEFERVLVEGAGSPAEINLREGDIANMGFAEAVDCPVILIADIDRGGVFAHIVGTLELLSPSERNRVKGFVINRFRGDIALLQDGLDWLEKRTGKPVLGVLPYLQDFHLEAEDAIDTRQHLAHPRLTVCVPVLSRIGNHTDFDALRLHPHVDFHYVRPGQRIPRCDLLILPGSKNTRGDLTFMRQQGWDTEVHQHLASGGKLLGICGGFQMLGQVVDDPLGIEGPAGSTPGLQLLDFNTRMQPDKILTRVSGRLMLEDAAIEGYEIHCGISAGPALQRPSVELAQGQDGAISENRQIIGTYLHGLFDASPARNALLRWAGMDEPEDFDYRQLQERELDRLADCLESHLDIAAIEALFSQKD